MVEEGRREVSGSNHGGRRRRVLPEARRNPDGEHAGRGRRSKMKRKEEGEFSGERQEEGVGFIDKEGGRACLVREK